ncbi:hypothetical protein HNO88_004091 [Novosphingobium chloroacetimidivorans]|uniref:Uncharacterized protein n=1 Tax=Novosphingobium chloroacetimidivorans TaxID=1428314 RepID=A0A7W7KE49_9SPHN|nr:hypothetical protein [Novosphingobium chloroacetimidivorans]MBB4860746.1 hypothetical protein [Novosphingobium chloroacetimidivorans]
MDRNILPDSGPRHLIGNRIDTEGHDGQTYAEVHMPTYTLITDGRDIEAEELVADGTRNLPAKVDDYEWNKARVLQERQVIFILALSTTRDWPILPGLPEGCVGFRPALLCHGVAKQLEHASFAASSQQQSSTLASRSLVATRRLCLRGRGIADR